jgi:hypothetical protein
MNPFNRLAKLRWLSLAALVVAYIVYALTDFSLGGSSPLGLLLVTTGGFLLRLKEPIGGNLWVLLSGLALLVFPFLYEATLWYAVLSLPIALDGVKGLLQWWKA